MIEPVTKTIGEHTYVFRPMTATPSLKLFSKVTKVAGPSFAALAGASVDPISALSAAAKALSENLGDDDIVTIVKAFAAQTEVDGKPLLPLFELHFMDIKKTFSFLMFAIEASWGTFFGASPESLSAAVEAAKAKAAKSLTSTGPSGG